MPIIDNVRLGYWSKQKALFSNTFSGCNYEIKKNKMENLINDDLDPSSSDESDNEFDHGSDNFIKDKSLF